MTTDPKKFDWTRFKRSVTKEVYDFWRLNHDSPLSEATFTEIMTNLHEGAEVLPKGITALGADWHEVYTKTQEEYGFWGVRNEGRI